MHLRAAVCVIREARWAPRQVSIGGLVLPCRLWDHADFLRAVVASLNAWDFMLHLAKYYPFGRRVMVVGLKKGSVLV